MLIDTIIEDASDDPIILPVFEEGNRRDAAAADLVVGHMNINILLDEVILDLLTDNAHHAHTDSLL